MRRAAAAAALVVVVATGCGGAEGAGFGLGGWAKILAGGKTRCARGGAYAFWLRKA